MTKKCQKCGIEKPIEDFYPRSVNKSHLRRSYCKECELGGKQNLYWQDRESALIKAKESYQRRADKYRAYFRKRHYETKNEPWRREQFKRSTEKYRATHREICLVRSKTNNAIISGKLARQPCEVCGTTIDVHAHHDDYSKPFEVRWLCRKHHNELHRGREYGEKSNLGQLHASLVEARR